MIFDISELPESKFAFSKKMCVCVGVGGGVGVGVCVCGWVGVCFLEEVRKNAFTHTRCYVGLDHFWQYLLKPPADVP